MYLSKKVLQKVLLKAKTLQTTCALQPRNKNLVYYLYTLQLAISNYFLDSLYNIVNQEAIILQIVYTSKILNNYLRLFAQLNKHYSRKAQIIESIIRKNYIVDRTNVKVNGTI